MNTYVPDFKNIWLADDDADDRLVFEIAIKEIRPRSVITAAANGKQLFELLRDCKALPDILFLDLNMPYKDGKQCLRELREKKTFDTISIVVYSNSDHIAHVNHAYGLGANLYLRKPNRYSELIKTLEDVLTLDWSDPKGIANSHFVGNNYVPFRAEV